MRGLVILTLVLLPAMVAAQYQPELVVDIQQGRHASYGQLYSMALSAGVEWQGYYYFGSDDGVHGFELWRSDGTAAGTELVRDICPGRCWGLRSDQRIVATESKLYLGVIHWADTTTGAVWESDGTRSGTKPVLGGMVHSEFQRGGVAAGELFFFDAVSGLGVVGPDGFQILAAIDDLRWIGAVDGVVLFSDSYNDPEQSRLWRSDGTVEGTHVLAGVLPANLADGVSPQGWNSEGPTDDGRLLFCAGAGSSRELWTTDGTQAGTQALGSGTEVGCPLYGRRVPGDGALLMYSSFPETSVWAWDPATDLVESLLEAEVVLTPSSTDYLQAFEPALGRLFFWAEAGSGSLELWVSDGSSGGTASTGITTSDPSSFYERLRLGGSPQQLLFNRDEKGYGYEFYALTDLGVAPVRIADLAPGLESGAIGPWFSGGPVAIGGSFLLLGRDDQQILPALWAWDSSELQLIDRRQDGSSGAPPCAFGIGACGDMARRGDEIFLAGFTTGDLGPELWRAVPQAGSGVLAVEPGVAPFQGHWFPMLQGGTMAPLGDRLVYSALDIATAPDYASAVAVTEGEGGPPQITSSDLGGDGPRNFLVAGDQLYFLAGSGWFRSDGSPAGTTLLVEAANQPVFSGGLAGALGGEHFCAAAEDGGILRCFEVEGLLQEDVQLPGPIIEMQALAAPEGTRLLLLVDEPGFGLEPWVSDLSPQGALRLADIQPGPASGAIVPPVRFWDRSWKRASAAVGRLGVLLGDDGTTGVEPWITNGTPGGTQLLADINPTGSSDPRRFTPMGDHRLFFVADDGTHGAELWLYETRGNRARLIADLLPGPESADPRELTPIGDDLYFTFDDGEHGVELWVAEGPGYTEIRRLTDLNPGPAASDPFALTEGPSSTLFFYANDGQIGYEPWFLKLPGVVFEDGFESGDVSAWSATVSRAGPEPPSARRDGQGQRIAAETRR